MLLELRAVEIRVRAVAGAHSADGVLRVVRELESKCHLQVPQVALAFAGDVNDGAVRVRQRPHG